MIIRRELPDTELATIATSRGRATEVLERHGLDFCCRGHQTLASACRDAGADLDAVVADLAEPRAVPAPDWASMSPVELIEHIESTHHRYLTRAFRELGERMTRVLEVHGERRPELREVERAFLALRTDLEPHLQKEEQILHPMIRELVDATDLPRFHCGSVGNPISVMQHEHVRAGELLASLRSATGDYVPPPDACATYGALYAGLMEMEQDIHLHIHKENNLLYPAVIAIERRLAGSEGT